MNELWANRLIAGTKTWAEMPVSRQDGVKEVLKQRVEKGGLTAEKYEEITGETYELKVSQEPAEPDDSAVATDED